METKTEPTYTLDQVFDEIKAFAKEHGLGIKSKKGLPKGVCQSAGKCVLANLLGERIIADPSRYTNGRYGVRVEETYDYIPFNSDILNTFVDDFDNKLYPELIEND